MANPTFFIKQNDTRPSLEVYLRDDKDRPVDITGATVVFNMRNAATDVAVVTNGTVAVISTSAGRGRYTFVAADTATAGTFDAEFQITFAAGGVETFPNDGHIKIIITDDVA